MSQIHFLLDKYVRIQNYSIPPLELKARVLSDPASGVVTMTNTLDHFEIDYLVVSVPKNALAQLPEHFICQLSNGDIHALALVQQVGNVINITVDKKKKFSLSKDEFLTEWTGFVLAIEKDTISWFSKNLKSVLSISSLCLSLTIILIYLTYHTGSVLNSFYVLLGFTGLAFSYLTFEQKINKNSFSSKFCSFSSVTDCDTVLSSREAKLFNLLDLSDLSIIYFSFSTFSFIFSPSHTIHFFLSVLSLPLIAYSLYSQYFQIKKWCPLCLGIISVLILQFLAISQINQNLDFEYFSLMPIGFISFIVIVSWIKLKTLLTKGQERNELEIENLTFRRNHDMFLSYYHSLQTIDDGLDVVPKIKIGTDNPVITLTSITNPSCPACIESHAVYKSLLEKHPDKVQVQIVFLLSGDNESKATIAQRLLELYFESDTAYFSTAIDEWYNKAEAEAWIVKWGRCSDKRYKNILKQQLAWCLKHHIDSTPTILVNGKLFPQAYRSADIGNFIKPILDSENELMEINKSIMHGKTETLNVSK